MLRLNPEILMRAYAAGIFPMAQSRDDPDLFWIDPEWRGVIPLDDFHVPRRLKRSVRHNNFEITADKAFADVVQACAEAGKGRPDSWINDEIAQAYGELARLGHAHSIECWHEGALAGGLYGVSLGGAFFGESMFSRKRDASKIALVHLVARLRVGGYTLLDSQFTTQHLQQFGAVELTRDAYKHILGEALEVEARFPARISDEELQAVLDASRPAP